MDHHGSSVTQGDPSHRWPARLCPGAIRFAHASSSYAETTAFYRDLVGLPVLGDFVASFGADGTIFGLPDTSVQMEIVRRRDDGNVSDGDRSDQLVLYLDGPAEVVAATEALREAGLRPDHHPDAYWEANGAVSYLDPDGRAGHSPGAGRRPSPADRSAGKRGWPSGS